MNMKEVTIPVHRMFQLTLNAFELTGLCNGSQIEREKLHAHMTQALSVPAKEA